MSDNSKHLVTSDSDVVMEFLKALGLDGISNISELSLNIKAGEVAELVITKRVTVEELQTLAAVVGARDLCMVGSKGVAITGKLLERPVPPDPVKEMKELAELMRKSTAVAIAAKSPR